MPRGKKENRGGKRTGLPGKAYDNRSDLNTNRGTQPITAVPNQPYGEAGEQIAAQEIAPLRQVPSGGQMAMEPQGAPVSVTPLDAPTGRPNEPVTAGVPIGPGVGPEALTIPDEDLDLDTLKGYLPGLEILASLPTTSRATRKFIRTLRSQVPSSTTRPSNPGEIQSQ